MTFAPPTPGETAPVLSVGGFEKLSLVDRPGRLAAVVFCQGCAWRCAYCHNPHLLPFGPDADAHPVGLRWPEILRWLERRRGLLDAVVFSGGEATLQPGLPDALRAVRALGFETGLHTGGAYPGRFARVLPLLDWVGFDFKAPFPEYGKVVGFSHGELARQSLRLLRDAGTDCEIRTTWHPALLSPDDLAAMAETLAAEGFAEWVIQVFRPDGCRDAALLGTPVGEPPVERLHRPGLRVVVR